MTTVKSNEQINIGNFTVKNETKFNLTIDTQDNQIIVLKAENNSFADFINRRVENEN